MVPAVYIFLVLTFDIDSIITDLSNQSAFFGYFYSPIDHASGEAHGKLEKDYVKWMKRKLEFKPSISSRVKGDIYVPKWWVELKLQDNIGIFFETEDY